MSIGRLLPYAAAVSLALAPAAPAFAAGGEKRMTSAVSYVSLATVSATLSQDFAIVGMIIVDAGLDVPDAALRTRAERMKPRLQDAMRAALAEYALARQRPGAAPDPDQIARMLQRGVDQALGQAGAQLLLSNVMIQGQRR